MSRMECPPEIEVWGAWAWQANPGFACPEPSHLFTGAAPSEETHVEVVPLIISDGSKFLPEWDFGRGFLPLVSRGVLTDVPGYCHKPV